MKLLLTIVQTVEWACEMDVIEQPEPAQQQGEINVHIPDWQYRNRNITGDDLHIGIRQRVQKGVQDE